jgi:cellulose synthase/poly-beta-1,6-N-acetylglucosamine synthase-like glycosyltransferase
MEQFQSLDFAGMMAITAAGIQGKYLYMCNGANLAYPKAVFEEVKGFEGVDGLASGDDMLLLQKIADRYPDGIQYLKTNAAVVLTAPMQTLSSFIQQRRRWASKSGSYKGWGTQLQLGLVWLFSLSMLLTLCLTPFLGCSMLLLWLIQFALKAIADYLLLNSACRFFKRIDLMKVFWPSLFLHWGYIIWVGSLGLLPTKYKWKGRSVK